VLAIAVFFFWRWALQAVERDDRVFGTDADRHENISHNGSSGFGGNAGSAETADRLLHLRHGDAFLRLFYGCPRAPTAIVAQARRRAHPPGGDLGDALCLTNLTSLEMIEKAGVGEAC
jgi:hypothetical protein